MLNCRALALLETAISPVIRKPRGGTLDAIAIYKQLLHR
jgi:hypothetical protein